MKDGIYCLGSNMKHSVIFWTKGIENVYSGIGQIAGIQVQISFWARMFAQKGWDVYSFSDSKVTADYFGINFIPVRESKYIPKIIGETFSQLHYIVKFKPTLIVYRGASRALFFLSFFSRVFGAELVFFAASDVDFIPGREIIGGLPYNKVLFRKGMRHIDKFVVQNDFQKRSLFENYQKESIVIPNIWMADISHSGKKRYDVIWISNLRKLKRAEWLIELAKLNPSRRFAIVGGALDIEYYSHICTLASIMDNVDFLGALSFSEINGLISASKILLCTSEFEGFPNTFLQAWAQNKPVVSTVNPSGVISIYGLGRVADTIESLNISLNCLLSDDVSYEECQKNISAYFFENHSAETAFRILTDCCGL